MASQTSYSVTIKVPAKSETEAAKKATVLQKFAKYISDEDFQKLSDKIKSEPDFFSKLSPYLSML